MHRCPLRCWTHETFVLLDMVWVDLDYTMTIVDKLVLEKAPIWVYQIGLPLPLEELMTIYLIRCGKNHSFGQGFGLLVVQTIVLVY